MSAVTAASTIRRVASRGGSASNTPISSTCVHSLSSHHAPADPFDYWRAHYRSTTVVDQGVIIWCMAGDMYGCESSDLVAIAILVIRAVLSVLLCLFRHPCFNVIPVNDGVESTNVIPVAVRDNQSLWFDPDIGDAIKHRLWRAGQPGIYQRRCLVRK